ncbi:hypothetical protein [Phormidesmis priestleyi]
MLTDGGERSPKMTKSVIKAVIDDWEPGVDTGLPITDSLLRLWFVHLTIAVSSHQGFPVSQLLKQNENTAATRINLLACPFLD